MENNPTFKQLKITQPNGSVKYVPLNPMTKQHYTEHSKWISPAKREKYKVEEVELSLDEAVEIGISEAIQVKFPPKKKSNTNSSDALVALLAEQMAANKAKDDMLADLAARLAALESKPKK